MSCYPVYRHCRHCYGWKLGRRTAWLMVFFGSLCCWEWILLLRCCFDFMRQYRCWVHMHDHSKHSSCCCRRWKYTSTMLWSEIWCCNQTATSTILFTRKEFFCFPPASGARLPAMPWFQWSAKVHWAQKTTFHDQQRRVTCTISIVRRNHMNMGAGAFAGHTTKPVLSAHQSLTPSIILQTCNQTWEFNQWSSWW